MIRLSDRSAPDGVGFEVSTRSLTRLVGVDQRRAGGLYRRLHGRRDDVGRWTATSVCSNADLASYRASAIAGPLNISADNGRYRPRRRQLAVAGGRSDGHRRRPAGRRAACVSSRPRASKDGADPAAEDRRAGSGPDPERLGRTRPDSAAWASGAGPRSPTSADMPDSRAARTFGGPIQRVVGPQRRALGPDLRRSRRRLADRHGRAGPPAGRRRRACSSTGDLDDGRIAEVEQGVLTGAAGTASARGLIEPRRPAASGAELERARPVRRRPGRHRRRHDRRRRPDRHPGPAARRPDRRLRQVAAGALTLTDADLILSFRKGADASDGRIVADGGSNYGPARASGNFFLGGNRDPAHRRRPERRRGDGPGRHRPGQQHPVQRRPDLHRPARRLPGVRHAPMAAFA